MFTSIDSFLNDWKHESENTARIMDALSDTALAQSPSHEDRSLARTAWHIVMTIPEMLARTGLLFQSVDEHAPIPATATAIASAYRHVAEEAYALIAAHWTDETLHVSDDMYGEPWKRGLTLEVLIRHEIHHRGQMTVLMRMAGLRVPGIYGPAREDWTGMGMNPPEI